MGVLAFILFIGLSLLMLYRLWQLRRFYRSTLDERPHYYYTLAISISSVGYVICGLFLSLSFLELFYFSFVMPAAIRTSFRGIRL